MKEANEEGNPNFEVNFIYPKHPTSEFMDAEEANYEGAYSWHKEHCPNSIACCISNEPPNLLSPLEK